MSCWLHVKRTFQLGVLFGSLMQEKSRAKFDLNWPRFYRVTRLLLHVHKRLRSEGLGDF